MPNPKRRISRERVRDLLAEGLTDEQVAQELACSRHTIQKLRLKLVKEGELEPRSLFDDDPATPEAVSTLDPSFAAIAGSEPDLPPEATAQMRTAADQAFAKDMELRMATTELEMDKVAREREQLSLGRPDPGPVDQSAMLMTMLQQANAQNQALMLKMIEHRAQPAPAAGGLESLAALMPLVTKMIDFVQGIRGDAEPKTSLDRVVEVAANSYMEAQKTKGAQPPAIAAPNPTPSSTQTSAAQTRVGGFFRAVSSEMTNRSDVRSVAIQLEQPLGLLPLPMREAILGAPLEVIVARMRDYLPAEVVQTFAGQVAGSEPDQKWLGELLYELSTPEEPWDPEEEPATNGAVADA